MRKLLLAGVAGLLSITGAYAAPIISSTAITNGGFTFTNFSCSPGGSVGTAAGGCSNLQVVANGASGIEFQGLLQALSVPAATTPSFLDVVLSYQVTAANPFSSISLAFNGAVTGSIAQAQVVESAFTAPGGTLLGTTQVNTPSPLQSTLTLSSARSSLYLVKDVSVTAFDGSPFSSASISFIDQTILGGGTTPGGGTPVPEPVSLALLGAGLLGFGLVRQIKRS